MKYTLYVRQHVRRAFVEGPVEYERALKHFDVNKFAVVGDEDGNIFYSKEELENAESIRSKPSDYRDYFSAVEPEIPEDSDRELSESDQDRTE